MRIQTIHRNPMGDVLNECSAQVFRITTENGDVYDINTEGGMVTIQTRGCIVNLEFIPELLRMLDIKKPAPPSAPVGVERWARTKLRPHEARCDACGRAVWDGKDRDNCIGFLAPCGKRVARRGDCGTVDCLEALAQQPAAVDGAVGTVTRVGSFEVQEHRIELAPEFDERLNNMPEGTVVRLYAAPVRDLTQKQLAYAAAALAAQPGGSDNEG